jgi:hypothetical protein
LRIRAEIERSVAGHIEGTVTPEGAAGSLPFSGVMELLAVIERCLDAATASGAASSPPGSPG